MAASVTPRSLLLSVHPRFARAILEGRKTVELRRHRVGASPGAAVILYATSPVMAVLGTAYLDSVDTGEPQTIWQRHGERTDLTEYEFHDYLNGCEVASALLLRRPATLLAPMQLSALRAVSSFQPPQSYRYVGLSDPVALQQLKPELDTTLSMS